MARRLKWTTGAELAINRRPGMRRDEYLAWMTFQGGDRIPFTEIFGPIVGLKEEWEEQGATAAELDFSAFRYRCPRQARVPVNTGRLDAWTELIEERDDYRRYRDDLGRTLKLEKGFATIPLPENYPVRTMDDWLAIKPRYRFDEARFEADWLVRAKRARDEGSVMVVGIPGGFDEPRQLLGEEGLCYAYYEQPELIHDILETIAGMVGAVLERVTEKLPVDVLSVHEDMAGKSGSLAGPRQIAEFIQPYYRRAWEGANARGTALFDQDSDGDMNAVIPAFLEAGVNCMHPMEPAAGMDIVQVRQAYGEKLAFYGGIDKHVLRRSRNEIEVELERKIPPMIRTRGCMIGLDHRIPNGTPLQNYRFYVNKVWEIIESFEA